MSPFSLIISENGYITFLKNDKPAYAYSAGCPLYGHEAEGDNFLLTGGYFSEAEARDEDDKNNEEEPVINQFFGTSRTFRMRLMQEGELNLVRSFNMQKQRQ